MFASIAQTSFAVGRTTLTAVTPVAVNVGKFAGPVIVEAGKTFVRSTVINAASLAGGIAGVAIVGYGGVVAMKAAKATKAGYIKTIRRLNARLDETTPAEAAEAVVA